MDIYEISNRSGVSLRVLRKLEKLGVLLVSRPDNPEIEKMQYDLRKGNALTTLQLCALIEDDSLSAYLGDYAGKALEQVKALGNVDKEKASAAIVALVDRAAKDDPAAVLGLVEWMQSTIPSAGDCNHHYLAVRLLLGAGKSLRAYVAGRVPRAFLNCRNTPEFASWFVVRQIKSRSITLYHRPANYSLDL